MSLPQTAARHRRVELVPDGREGRRVRVRQIDRTARPVPQAAQLPGRAAPPERPEGRPARLLRHVADRRAAAQPEARHLQLGRPRSGGRPAHEAVLPAAVAGAVDRRRHRVPVADGHDLVQPRRPADPGGEQPPPRLQPPVPRRPRLARGRAREAAAADQARGRRGREREGARQAARQVRPRADGPVPDVAQRGRGAADRLREVDRHAAEEAGLLAPESRRDVRGRARRLLPQHVRPDRAGVRRRHHPVGRVHAQPRGRHGHQRHVPDQARPRPHAPQPVARRPTRTGSWRSPSTTCSSASRSPTSSAA